MDAPPVAFVDYCNATAEIERIKRSHASEKLRLRKQTKAGKELLLAELQAREATCLTSRDGTVYVHRKIKTSNAPFKIDASLVAMALSSFSSASQDPSGNLREAATEHVLSKLRGAEITKESIEVSTKPPKEDVGSAESLTVAVDKVAIDVHLAQIRLKDIGVAETAEATAAKKQKAGLEEEALQYLAERQYACARVETKENKFMVRSHKRHKVAKLDMKHLAPMVADAVQAVANERGVADVSLQRSAEELVTLGALNAIEERVAKSISQYYDQNTSEEQRVELVENA